MIVRLYVDVEGLDKLLKEENGEDFVLDIVGFHVYECPSKNGTYDKVTTNGLIDYDPTKNFIEPDVGHQSSWFKVSWVDSLGVESELSDPMLSEVVADFVNQVAIAMNDLNRESDATCAFRDEEYVRMMRRAIHSLTQSDTTPLSALSESEFETLLISVRQACCYVLAYETARYYKLAMPEGLVLERNQIPEHYMALAKALGQHFKEAKDEIGAINPQQMIEVLQATTTSPFYQPKLPQARRISGIRTKRVIYD